MQSWLHRVSGWRGGAWDAKTAQKVLAAICSLPCLCPAQCRPPPPLAPSHWRAHALSAPTAPQQAPGASCVLDPLQTDRQTSATSILSHAACVLVHLPRPSERLCARRRLLSCVLDVPQFLRLRYRALQIWILQFVVRSSPTVVLRPCPGSCSRFQIRASTSSHELANDPWFAMSKGRLAPHHESPAGLARQRRPR